MTTSQRPYHRRYQALSVEWWAMGRYDGQSGEFPADERESQVIRQQTEDCHAEAMRLALTIAARSDNRRAIVSDSLQIGRAHV